MVKAHIIFVLDLNCYWVLVSDSINTSFCCLCEYKDYIETLIVYWSNDPVAPSLNLAEELIPSRHLVVQIQQQYVKSIQSKQ